MRKALQDIALFQEQLEQAKARKTSADAHESDIERTLADAKKNTQSPADN